MAPVIQRDVDEILAVVYALLQQRQAAVQVVCLHPAASAKAMEICIARPPARCQQHLPQSCSRTALASILCRTLTCKACSVADLQPHQAYRVSIQFQPGLAHFINGHVRVCANIS